MSARFGESLIRSYPDVMELYQLKTFLAVSEEQHLTRAAARLHISQPSVSTHIRSLEEELGLKLFIRTPKGMLLSHEGQLLKLKAELALQAAAAVKDQADRLKKNVRGPVRIGLNIDAQYLRASDLLTVLQRRYPNVAPYYCQRHSQEAHDQLQSGQIDAAFVFEVPKNSGFEAKRLGEYKIVVVAPYKWKRRLQKVKLEDLAGSPWIWTDDRCPFNRIISGLFRSTKMKPVKRLVVEDDTTIRKMVAAGAGLGLMVEPEAHEAAKRKELSIWGDPVFSLDLFALYLKKRANEPIVKAVIEAIREVWGFPPSK